MHQSQWQQQMDYCPVRDEGKDHVCEVCNAWHKHHERQNPGVSYWDNPFKQRKMTMKCEKCNVYLCCSQHNCFKVYHMNEWMNENLYIAHKKLPHKILRVHSARYTQCIHVSSCKLKLPKGRSYQKLQTAHAHPPLPKSGTIHSS